MAIMKILHYMQSAWSGIIESGLHALGLSSTLQEPWPAIAPPTESLSQRVEALSGALPPSVYEIIYTGIQ